MLRVFGILAFLAALACHTAASAFEATYQNASTTALNNPHDIVLSGDGRLLYVSDLGNNRIAVLDAKSLKLLGAFGARELAEPHDVAFGRNGALYVADTRNHRIAVYDVTGVKGRLVRSITGPFRAPEGVFAHPNSRVYVAGAWSGNLVAFENGKPVKQAKGLSSPHDIDITASGDIWVADAGNNRLILMSPDLAIKKEFKGRPYNFNGPRYFDLTKKQTLVVADKYTHSVKAIARDGRLLKILGSGKAGKGPGLFTTPEGIEIRGSILWIADSGNNRIVRYAISE